MTGSTILTIILNFRTPELTLKATKAAVREMAGLSGEIVIVDNHSEDDSLELLSQAIAANGWDKDGHVRIVQSCLNGGFGAGNNLAIRGGLSNGETPDFVYILNSDAWPEPGAIRVLSDFLEANPNTGMVGGYVQGVDTEPHQTAFRFPSIAGEFEAAARTGVFSRLLKDSIVALPIPKQDTQVDWVAGASLMMRRKM
ncbi:MAG: N-acetylglucosaminyl-diphospho-decaprenol L-rhamnosyltransferase, partial [Granulosicoccus sp.]